MGGFGISSLACGLATFEMLVSDPQGGLAPWYPSPGSGAGRVPKITARHGNIHLWNGGGFGAGSWTSLWRLFGGALWLAICLFYDRAHGDGDFYRNLFTDSQGHEPD